VRAIYAAAKESGAPREELARIAKVGRELGRALDLVGAQGAAGETTAWQIVERAMLALDVGPLTAAAPILRAATRRVEGARQQKQKSRRS
jgi:hypothetical protein